MKTKEFTLTDREELSRLLSQGRTLTHDLYTSISINDLLNTYIIN